MTRWQADYTKFLPSWKDFPLGGFLSVLCVLAVNTDLQFNRQVAKDAKKTPSKTIWLRRSSAVKIGLLFLSFTLYVFDDVVQRFSPGRRVRIVFDQGLRPLLSIRGRGRRLGIAP